MAKRLSKRQIREIELNRVAAIETVKVRGADLRPGMVEVNKAQGILRMIDSVGDDVHSILASRVKAWTERGLPTEGAQVRYTHRVDDMPGAEYERNPVPCITPPFIEVHGVKTAAADLEYDIDVATI